MLLFFPYDIRLLSLVDRNLCWRPYGDGGTKFDRSWEREPCNRTVVMPVNATGDGTLGNDLDKMILTS